MALTDTKLRALKPSAKLYRVADGGGLCIEVLPNGSKFWRFRYRFNGTAKMLSVGSYPERSLQAARKERDALREQVKAGADPSEQRKAEKLADRLATTNSFEGVAREWLSKQHLADTTRAKALWMFEDLTFPWIGSKPVSDIKPQDILTLLRRIEARGKLETAHRVKQQASRVFRYAVVTGRAENDPTTALRGAIQSPKTRHMAAITDENQVGPLLRAIDSFDGTFVVACALKLAPMLFVRPGELRKAEWSEFDLDAAEWKIPAMKMKMRSAHIVPLSTQAVAVLRELHPLTGKGVYLFPSNRGRGRPMSEGTVLAALRRMGYEKNAMSGHGFRAMARTLLAEQGWQPEIIERQLAHKASGPLGEAYDRARFLPQRRKMMQAWSDYLEALAREETKVTPIRRAGNA